MDSDIGNRYSTKFPNAIKWLLLFLAFLISNTCQDAPRKNPLDPENPESDAIKPPLVTDIYLTQVNMGFELSWSKVDSTIPGISGYHIVRSDSVIDRNVDFETNLLVDTEFEASDSGQVFYYEIRATHSSASGELQGEANTSPSRILIAIPINIDINVKGVIKGVVGAEPARYTDQRSVLIETSINDGKAEHIIVSESPSLAGAQWETFKDTLWYTLSDGDGPKNLYVKCKDITDRESNFAQDSIILDTSPPTNFSVEIIPFKNKLYENYPLEVGGITPSLTVKLILTATDLARWKACINNESADFPDNPECTSYTNGDSLEKIWTLSPRNSEATVFARFEDELDHIENDNIISSSIEYDPTPPDSNAGIIIDDNNLETESNYVSLELTNSDKNIFQMNISNDANFPDDGWLPYQPIVQNWGLNEGNGYDTRTVYVKFMDKAGNKSTTYYSDDIILNPPPSAPTGLAVDSVANSMIWIRWNANPENDIQKYIIYRGSEGSEPDSIAETTLTYYIDSGLKNGVDYEYVVRTLDNTYKKSTPSSGVVGTPVNKSPRVHIVITPTEGTRKTFFRFDATGSLDDATPPESLEVRWDFGGDGIWDLNFSIESQVVDSVAFPNTGDVSIICEVRDEEQAIARKDTTVHINIPPNKPSISVPGGPYYRSTDVCLTALGNDPDGNLNSMSFRWIISGDTLGWSEAGIPQICFQSDTLGSVSAKVQCKDAWEEPSEWSNTVTIEIENKPPIAGFTISPDSVGRRDSVFTFCATSGLTSDEHTPYNDLLIQWKFKVTDDWTPTPATTQKCTTHSYSNETDFSFDVSLRVTDSDGTSTDTTRRVRINRPPDQPTLSATPTTTYKREPVTFTATASDPDGDELEYNFDFGDELSGWTSFSQLTHSYESTGSYDARVLVRDSWGDSSSWSPSIQITIDNRPPNTPSSITVSPSTIYAGDIVTVRARVSDEDNDDIKLFIQWAPGDVESSNVVSSGSLVSMTHTYNTAGTKTISLYTQDTDGEQSTETDVTFTVYAETITTPGRPSGPSSGYVYTSYTYSTSGAISNAGHSLQYRFQWGDGSNSGWLSSKSASKTWSVANTYSVTVQARCATHTNVLSGPSNSRSVTINPETITRPGTPSGPSSGYTNTSYTFSTSGASSNLGHSLRYRFHWGDGSTSSWSSSLSASHSWSNEGSYPVQVEARCATHTNRVSLLSNSRYITISIPTSTFRVTFEKVYVYTDGDAWPFGAGDFYWTFELLDAFSRPCVLHQVLRDQPWKANDEETITVNDAYSAPFVKDNTSGSSFTVRLSFAEADDPPAVDDYLRPYPYTKKYSYPSWPTTGTKFTILEGDEAKIKVYWRIDKID